MIRQLGRLVLAAHKAFEKQGNPWAGDDEDLKRTWEAVDTATRSIAVYRNIHETRICVYRRFNHAAVEGFEYRGAEA